MGRVKRIWYLSPRRAAKVQVSLRICAVLPEPPLLAHTSSESRGTFRQKARSLAPLNGWAFTVKICHDGMLEDTNSLDAAQVMVRFDQLRLEWREMGREVEVKWYQSGCGTAGWLDELTLTAIWTAVWTILNYEEVCRVIFNFSPQL